MASRRRNTRRTTQSSHRRTRARQLRAAQRRCNRSVHIARLTTSFFHLLSTQFPLHDVGCDSLHVVRAVKARSSDPERSEWVDSEATCGTIRTRRGGHTQPTGTHVASAASREACERSESCSRLRCRFGERRARQCSASHRSQPPTPRKLRTHPHGRRRTDVGGSERSLAERLRWGSSSSSPSSPCRAFSSRLDHQSASTTDSH
jgi:hypothetical protein